jgi:hypothetical protein
MLFDTQAEVHARFSAAGARMLLGARLSGGVAIRPANYEKWSRVERVVIAVPYYKERAYWDFLKAQPGKPYDKLAIVAFAVNRDWRARCLVL